MQHLPDWQQALAQAITDPVELCKELALDSKIRAELLFPKQFPLRVPRRFVARMQKGNPNDPLLLQVLPIAKELSSLSGFCSDPLHEKQVNPVPGLLHKYQGRVLLMPTGACAIHCRFCFRRHFPYDENTPGTSGWEQAFQYIANDPSIEEVILSGGDPLIVKDAILLNLMDRLASIPQVKTLRIHTRIPIVLPERITPSLITLLTNTRLKTVIVIHCNHPQEIDETVEAILQRCQKAGITLLNQFVLLRNINNQAETLIQLCRKLFQAGVLPYYLHLLDPVAGSAHFSVSVAEGQQLIKTMAAQLPGYLVPRLVQEVSGEAAKVTL